MATETAGIREIDAGTLPDRYARGWHCLGPAKDYVDGEPHGIEAFGTHLVVFGDSHGACTPSTAIAGTWAATWRRAPSRVTRSPVRSTTGGGAAAASASWCPTRSEHPGWPVPGPGRQMSAAGCCTSGTTTRATRHRRNSASRSYWRWNSMLIEGSNCREIIDNVTDMAHFFYIHFGLPTYFKNVFEGHVASRQRRATGRQRPGHLVRRGASGFGGVLLRPVVHDQLAAQQVRRLTRPS